jgi:hypothetical protein
MFSSGCRVSGEGLLYGVWVECGGFANTATRIASAIPGSLTYGTYFSADAQKTADFSAAFAVGTLDLTRV